MSSFAEEYLKWRKSQTGYECPLPPPYGVSAPQPLHTVPSVARSSQPTARPTAVEEERETADHQRRLRQEESWRRLVEQRRRQEEARRRQEEVPRRDERVGLTPNGLIVRQPSAGDDNRPPMGDLTIDLNIQAPVTNHARW